MRVIIASHYAPDAYGRTKPHRYRNMTGTVVKEDANAHGHTTAWIQFDTMPIGGMLCPVDPQYIIPIGNEEKTTGLHQPWSVSNTESKPLPDHTQD